MRPRRKSRPTSLAPGMRIGGAWRIERELGRGGMATVYAVVHARFGKRAAVKLAHSAAIGPQFTSATFLREARMANLINHPGVAEVFATGTCAGRPYLAMERLTGRSLGARLDDGPLPRDEAFDILLELCDVLEASRAAGITHRDLKLDNVFLLDEPGAGGRRTKLLDWGMARIAGEADPLRGMIAGTLTYAAPEQFRSDEITPAADVYSLGVVAYLLLLGRAPFISSADLDLIRRHLLEPPPAPRTLWAGIPAELEATLLAMLAKEPEDRPALADIARALRNARARLRPGVMRWLTPPVTAPRDVLGRPAVPLLATRRTRIASAALGIALTLASVVQLLSA
jgi:serine/threonine-protein kinase